MPQPTLDGNVLEDLVHETDQDLVIATLKAIVPSVAGFLGSHCEVVVHDLRVPERSIVCIANGHVTGRVVGGPLIGGPLEDLGMQWIKQLSPTEQVLVYETKARDDRRLKSTTRLFRDVDNKPYAAFCINLDVDAFAPIATWLSSLVDAQPNGSKESDASQPHDVDEILRETIEDCLAKLRYTSDKHASKSLRLSVVREMDKRGVFLIRGAVRLVAKRLNVSKFTVYRYLDEARGEE